MASALFFEFSEERLADRSGPIPLDEAAATASKIAMALGAAHEKGIIQAKDPCQVALRAARPPSNCSDRSRELVEEPKV